MTAVPAAPAGEAVAHFHGRLAFETDPADVAAQIVADPTGPRATPSTEPGRAAPDRYSMTRTTSPAATAWPASTFTSATVPSLSAVMAFSIFMASSRHTV